VFPERETGLRLAHSFQAAGVRDYLDVAPGHGVARVSVPMVWIGKTLGDIDLVRNHQVTALALHGRDKVVLNPPLSEVLHEGDDLIVVGLDENLAQPPRPEKARSSIRQGCVSGTVD
jgi:trk system potassium uptake protein